MIAKFEIERDDLTAIREALRRKLANRRQLNAAAAASAAVPIMRNFDSLSSSNHNAFGVPSTFWGLMKAGTHPGADSDFGYVAMPAPVALRYFGGTVYPGAGKKMLAIPARSEAYNKSPRDFTDLRIAVMGGGPSGNKTVALVQNDQQHIKYGPKRKNGSRKVTPGAVSGGGVYFWLVPSATIRGDKNVLPPDDVLTGAAVTGLRDYISHLEKAGSN